MNRIIYLILLLGLLRPACGFSQSDKKDIIYNWNTNQSSLWISIDSTFQKFAPSDEEINLAKEIAINYIDSLESTRNSQIRKEFGKILKYNHARYYRQYVAFIDNEGKKKIFINAVCDSFVKNKDLKKEWIFVLDGGSCFFQMEVDLETEEITSFSVNGEA
ncbi:MAG: hypothetical protein M3512_11810 [Bacteroidota bacterium]|nr:hypothetical protein [Bacteroidota bacterium]